MYLIDTNVISAAGEGFEELDIAIWNAVTSIGVPQFPDIAKLTTALPGKFVPTWAYRAR